MKIEFVTYFKGLTDVKRKRTSKFLKQFFNELFVLQRKISALTGCHAIMETHIKFLLLLKIILIVRILIESAQRFNITSNYAFPVFELAYIANYVILRKLLILHKVLKKWIKQQVDQYTAKSQCTAECKLRNDPICKAISLWSQSGQILTNYLKYFNWYKKLVLMENIFCVYLASQFVVCVFYKRYDYNVGLLSDSLNHIINMLLIGMVNDSLKHEEDALNDILTVLVIKLSHQTRLCKHCKELLRAIDYHFCCRNLLPKRIYIFGNYWTREFVVDVIQNLIVLGFSITQFGSDGLYLCKFGPETSRT
ncbi:uncharacterized protein LOC128921571 [Zeugodacus cucurbitae]|uniref:uncharacterized protein LOC128921571 n=1 Tax=Zeugodacus cucurbitae TaxID=28588 RepID=UPI0023D91559|nr:uncharacterized protein LOC128921571 [Zeugodacus cucurbitae]